MCGHFIGPGLVLQHIDCNDSNEHHFVVLSLPLKFMEVMAMDTTQRMVPLEGGRRAGIKLDKAAWQAIDWLSAQEGKTWQQWCAKVIECIPEGINVTAAVRTAAMDALVFETIVGERGESLAAMADHPLLKDSGTLNERQLDAVMKHAQVQGWSDFGGFSIYFGHDEHGQDCVWIKNGLRNGLHFAFVLSSSQRGAK